MMDKLPSANTTYDTEPAQFPDLLTPQQEIIDGAVQRAQALYAGETALSQTKASRIARSRNGEVTSTRPDQEAWAAALIIARGDPRRLT